MQPRCKKCGKPLRSAESIARGMGPECAGISLARGRSTRSRKGPGTGLPYNATGKSPNIISTFAWVEDGNRQTPTPGPLLRFPTDLLGLVLSSQASGSIASYIKSCKSKNKDQNGSSPIVTLKAIRRTCIDLRMLFWPGFSFKGEPLACIPCGESNWRIGKEGREISANELIAYLSRYRVI